MAELISIDPNGVYDGSTLRLALGITSATLAAARRSGRLRHTRKGRRVFYLGEWVLAWLKATEAETAHA